MISLLHDGFVVSIEKNDIYLKIVLENDFCLYEKSFTKEDCLDFTQNNFDLENLYETLNTILLSKTSDSTLSISKEGEITLAIRYQFGTIKKEMKFSYQLEKKDIDPIYKLEKKLNGFIVKVEERLDGMEKLFTKTMETFEAKIAKIEQRLNVLDKPLTEESFRTGVSADNAFMFDDDYRKVIRNGEKKDWKNAFGTIAIKKGMKYKISLKIQGLVDTSQAITVGVCIEDFLSDKTSFSKSGLYNMYSNQSYFINGNGNSSNIVMQNGDTVEILVDRVKEEITFIYNDDYKTFSILEQHRYKTFYFVSGLHNPGNQVTILSTEITK